MKHTLVLAGCVIAAALGGTPLASGAVIKSVSYFGTPGYSTGSITVGSNPAPNNDDELGQSPNVIPGSVFFNSAGYLETEFVLDQSGGTTEYLFKQNFVNSRFNNQWVGFRFELGFGTGSNFVLSLNGDDLRFDSWEGHTTATSNKFDVTLDESKRLDWGGAAIPSFNSVGFTFAIDVPDDLGSANPAGLNRFTLRQTPILESTEPAPSPTPEPATFGVVGVALVGLGWQRWAKRKV